MYLTIASKIRDNGGMRAFRLVLVCLVSLGVSLQGVASMLTFEAPCPMSQAAEHSMDSAAADETGHDCCNDAATFAKTGKVCKTNLSCQSMSQAAQTASTFFLRSTTAQMLVPAPDRDIPAPNPNPVWRPPALI